MPRVLWADDDTSGIMECVVAAVRRDGQEIETRRTYESALKAICDWETDTDRERVAVVDVVLGTDGSSTTAPWNLGIRLGLELRSHGVARLAVVSVVPKSRFKDELTQLRVAYGATNVYYVNKLDLLENGRIDELANFVWTGKPEPKA